LMLAATCLLFVSCRNKADREYMSAKVNMGNGTVHSWVKTDYTGKPKSVGLTMTSSALDGLPTSGPGHELHNAFELPLFPSAARLTPFNHIVINWNPGGHQPIPPYGTPHFDFHLYMMSSAERKKIPAVDSANPGAFAKFPPVAYLPAGYVTPPPHIASEAKMGIHWINTNAPEVKGTGPFSYHFIYGSYDGKVNFIEPMITLDTFRAMSDFKEAVPRPEKVAITGYYPTLVHIFQEDGNYVMSFEEMEYRTGE
jgi:hypothetical protein